MAPLLVLLHGPGQSPPAWQSVVENLDPERPMHAPWLRGLKPTESGQFDLTAASVAIEQMLELRGVEKVDLVGNSLGGMVALRVAAENPSVVRRLVLISTPVIPSKSALRMQRAVLALRPARRFTEVPKATVLEALDALARSEISTDLSRVKVPTLAIVPAADQPLLAAAEVLRQQLGATVETVDGEGDLVRDHGDRIASLIDDFTRGE